MVKEVQIGTEASCGSAMVEENEILDDLYSASRTSMVIGICALPRGHPFQTYCCAPPISVTTHGVRCLLVQLAVLQADIWGDESKDEIFLWTENYAI